MNSIFKIQEEQQKYINELGLENSDSLFNKKPSYTRGTHRLLEYSKWCQLQVHGKRVILFQQFQRANSWMEYKMGLSSTEWTDAIKLHGNLSRRHSSFRSWRSNLLWISRDTSGSAKYRGQPERALLGSIGARSSDKS